MMKLSRSSLCAAALTGLLSACAVPMTPEPRPDPAAEHTTISQATVFRYGGEYNLTDMTFAFVGSDLMVDLEDCGSDTTRCLSSGFEVLLAPRCDTLEMFPPYAYGDMEIMSYGRTVIEDYYGKAVPVSVYAVSTRQEGQIMYSLSFFNPQYGVIATAITETAPKGLTTDAKGQFTNEFPLFYSKTETGAFACS